MGEHAVGNAKRWAGVVAFVVIVGSCNNAFNDDEPTDTTGSSRHGAPAQLAAAPASAPVPVRAVEAECASDDVIYDGQDTCHPGGELVAVLDVLDGNTLELDDARVVRLLGVEVPDADACAGPGAAEFTRALVQGKQVKLHIEPGVETDDAGRLLRYVQFAESTDRAGLPIYAHDLGNEVVLNGWGKPSGDQANATYLDSLASAAGIAEYQPEGIYAPPCGSPLVFGDDDGDGTADWDEQDNDDAPNVDAPSVDLPDGALTGGYCARKWWC
jgi:endonuclease YncB( thermonuclease family)